MPAHHINFLAVITATFAAFAIGGAWYSPMLFAGAWRRVNGFSEASVAAQNKSRVFGLAFILTFIMAINLAMFLDTPTTTMVWGAAAGFLAGFGWVALGLAIISLFESRPFTYVAINGGYMVVTFTVMGAIIGGWR